MSVTEQLRDFLARQAGSILPRSLWLSDDRMQVYVRKARRCLDGEMIWTLDIATVDVVPEAQNGGLFTRFLREAVALNPWKAIYVENVQTDRFCKFFERWGFTRVGEPPSPSYYFLLPQNAPNLEASQGHSLDDGSNGEPKTPIPQE